MKRVQHDIKVGDMVWLKTQNRRQGNAAAGASAEPQSHKLDGVYFRVPFEVVAVHSNTVRIQPRVGDTFHPVVNVDQVRKVKLQVGDNASQRREPEASQAPIQDVEYKVKGIKGYRWNGAEGHLEWEVEWEGYDETTWEPQENLTDNEQFLRYCQQHPIRTIKKRAKKAYAAALRARQHARGRVRVATLRAVAAHPVLFHLVGTVTPP